MSSQEQLTLAARFWALPKPERRRIWRRAVEDFAPVHQMMTPHEHSIAIRFRIYALVKGAGAEAPPAETGLPG